MTCPLCRAEKITEWLYEDDRIYICRCKSHPSKWMVVLKKHTSRPSNEELSYMFRKAKEEIGAGVKLRGPNSILDHFHLHEV